MASYGYTFTSGDSVTPTKLNNARTVSNIVNADVASAAAILGSKISPDFGSQNVTTTGTVTASKLVPSGTSATGNGLYLPETNTVAISTNGGERLRVDASGNTGIGTTTTTAARLTVADASANDAIRITQTGAGNALVVEDSTNPDSTPTVIDASGNIVVGHTSAPTVASLVHPLSVVGAGAAVVRAAADAFGAVITFVKSRSTGIGGTRAIVLNNDELGAIEFAADNGANLNVIAASISAECDGTAGSADMPARIVFRTTADGAASPTERMRITNGGNVGIGKTPTTALDVNGTVTATAFAGPLTGNVTGNVTGSVATLTTGRTIAMTGDVAYTSPAFDGSANVTAAATIGALAVTTGKIADAAVSFAKIQNSAAAGLSVVGRSAASAGDFAEISAATDGHILRRSGAALGFGTIATAGIADDAVTDVKLRNSAALSVIGRSANSTGDPADIAAATDGHVLRRSGTALGFGTIATAGIADTAVTTAKLATTTQNALVPAGAVMPFAMNTAPSGWLAANGAAVSRTTYADLFDAIGVVHGAGDSVTTFNLPDLRGIFVRGSGSQTISGTTYSGTFAAKEKDEFKSHTHPYVGRGGSGNTVTGGPSAINDGFLNMTTSATGGTETRPANIALLYCIKF